MEARQLCPRNVSSTRTVQIKEVEPVAVRTAVVELPCIPMPAFALLVGYAPGHLVYLQIIACGEDVLAMRLIKRGKFPRHGMHPIVYG